MSSAPATGRIVVGVDASSSSFDALEWAFDEARRRGATLEIVHAWMLPAFDGSLGYPLDAAIFEEAGAKALSAAAATLPAEPHDPKVVTRLERGSAAEVLLAAAEGAEMVVVGSHGRGALSELFLGSTSHQIVNRARCPVVVIRS